jgi:hypothetical protein
MPDAPLDTLGLGEAYEQAFRRLCDAEALVAGLTKPPGPAAKRRVRAEWRRMRARVRAKNRRALAKWRQTRAEGLALPDKPDEFPDEWPHPDDWPSSDPEGERAYDDARDAVEVRMREAIAKGELDYFTRDPRTGQVLRGLDRESWTESMSPPGFGLSNDIHNATCPGPVELEGRLVFLDAIEFEEWLEREIQSRQAAEPSTIVGSEGSSVVASPTEPDKAPSEGSQANTPPKRRRGPKPEKLSATVAAMREDVAKGVHTLSSLVGSPEKELADRYGVSRDTARKARNQVLSESEFVENSNPDK